MTRHHPFCCALCKRETQPAGPGAKVCPECSGILERQYEAAHERFEALTPEEKHAAGEAVFAAVQANLPPIYQRSRER